MRRDVRDELCRVLRSRASHVYLRDLETGMDVTYADVHRSAAGIAADLRRAQVQGRVVGIRLSDPMWYAPAILACWECGAAAALFNPLAPVAKQAREWQTADPAAVVSDLAEDASRGVPLVTPRDAAASPVSGPGLLLRALDPDSPCLLLFSSGSTGVPKCVPHSLRSIASNVESFSDRLGMADTDAFLSVSPLWYAHGLYNGFLTTLMLGATVLYHRHPSIMTAAGILRAARQAGATVFHATPAALTLFTLVAARNQDPRPPFRWVIAGTASLAQRDKEAFERVFQVPVTQQYGMTETLFMAVNDDRQQDKPSSVGRPVGCVLEVRGADGMAVRPGETGELFARSPAAFGSYFRQPAETAAAYSEGWFRTGDLGFFDDEGYLTITGRCKDIIKRAGFAIAPQDIDAVIMTHPGVLESATVGAPDALYGEEVYTFATAATGVSEASILAHCHVHLHRTHVPRRIFLSDGLPKTDSGKIKKHELQERLKGLLASH